MSYFYPFGLINSVVSSSFALTSVTASFSASTNSIAVTASYAQTAQFAPTGPQGTSYSTVCPSGYIPCPNLSVPGYDLVCLQTGSTACGGGQTPTCPAAIPGVTTTTTSTTTSTSTTTTSTSTTTTTEPPVVTTSTTTTTTTEPLSTTTTTSTTTTSTSTTTTTTEPPTYGPFTLYNTGDLIDECNTDQGSGTYYSNASSAIINSNTVGTADGYILYTDVGGTTVAANRDVHALAGVIINTNGSGVITTRACGS